MIRKKRKKARIFRRSVLLAFGLLLGVILAVYVYFCIYYRSHFFPNTLIADTDVSGMTEEEAVGAIKSEVNDYLLTIFDRDGNKYHILGADVDYNYESRGEELDLLKEQKWLFWPGKLLGDKNLEMEKSITYNSELLREQVQELACLSPSNMAEPTDAYIDLTENGYELVEETQGNYLLEEKAYTRVKAAVENGEVEITFAGADYQKPERTSKDEVLTQCMKDIQSFLGAKITYDIEGRDEVVDNSVISSWIEVNEDYTVTFDEDAVTSYVQKLASTYNTYGRVREFKTSKGDTISIGGGDYGWVVDKEAEKEKLLKEVKNGETVTREPEYSQTTVSRSENDIGNTYIEIDYTNQHLWYYKDGRLQIDEDFVSGNISKGNGSPDGVFKIVYKSSPAVLKGEDYESNVEYFMPFAYNVGIHDASWRSQFGGNIYKTSGSHGCINMPPKTVTELYKVVEVGTPVIAFYREEVTLTAENTKISNAFSYKDPEKKEEQKAPAQTQTPVGEGQVIEEDGSIVNQ